MLSADIPSFLNECYLTKALSKAYATKVQVKKCEIRLASANGENFCSAIYRAHVVFTRNSGELEEKSLVLKVMIPEITEIGTNEHIMYGQVLPAMEEQMMLIDATQRVRFGPACLMIDRVHKDVYVLEDLNAIGYSLADRFLGLDEPHAALVMKKLGQYHAASMVFIAKFPEIVQTLQASHFAKGAEDQVGNAIAFGGMEHAMRLVAKWPNFDEISVKMKAIIGSFDKRVKALVNPRNSKVQVLTHGDLWVNNFLYSYENDVPKDVIFVDFQNSFLGSPGFDIHYILNTSVRLEVLSTKRYELLRIYYDSLRRTLLMSGFDPRLIPTMATIMQEIRNTEFFGYYAAVCELPICCMSKQASLDMTVNSFGDKQFMELKRRQIYEENPRVLAMLRYSLDRFNELGVMD